MRQILSAGWQLEGAKDLIKGTRKASFPISMNLNLLAKSNHFINPGECIDTQQPQCYYVSVIPSELVGIK
jgi:hypothetical protein